MENIKKVLTEIVKSVNLEIGYDSEAQKIVFSIGLKQGKILDEVSVTDVAVGDKVTAADVVEN